MVETDTMSGFLLPVITRNPAGDWRGFAIRRAARLRRAPDLLPVMAKHVFKLAGVLGKIC
jgi:hypothetical protein